MIRPNGLISGLAYGLFLVSVFLLVSVVVISFFSFFLISGFYLSDDQLFLDFFYRTKPPRPTQPGHPSAGRHSE